MKVYKHNNSSTFHDYIISAKEFNKLFYLCSKFKKDTSGYPYKRVDNDDSFALSFKSNLYIEKNYIRIYISNFEYRFIEPISFEILCKLTYKDRKSKH